MCDFEKGFILCTCEDEPQKEIQHNKRSRRSKKKNKNKPKPIEYEWYLYEFVEEIVTQEKGRFIMPTFNIGKGLTSEWVLLNLNEGECFDFDYTPKEGDNLMIKQKGILTLYLSFIYKNNEWEEGVYDAFSIIIKENLAGKIKVSSETTSNS